MTSIGDRRSAPPDALRDLHRRIAVVLADLNFPAQRWQLIATADLYGADAVTRTIIERAPEQRYQTLSEVVAVLAAVFDGRPYASVPTPVDPPRPAPSRPLASAPLASARVPSRQVPSRRVAASTGSSRRAAAPAGSPRPAA